MTNSFQLDYEPLLAAQPQWGHAAIIPWDTEIFGFPVAQLQLGDAAAVVQEQSIFSDAVMTWAKGRKVATIACRVAGAGNRNSAENGWTTILSKTGWHFVEYSMLVQIVRLQKVALPRTTIAVRPVESDDCQAVLKIAQSAFNAGRYHADPLFPLELANRRYYCWMENALRDTLATDNVGNRVYVIGQPGRVVGFLHAVIQNGVVDMRLAAVDSEVAGGLAGYNLYIGALAALRDEGVLHMQTRVAASNTAVLNIYSMIGCRFTAPEAVFHWWAPNAVL
jgi:hypothetical protein